MAALHVAARQEMWGQALGERRQDYRINRIEIFHRRWKKRIHFSIGDGIFWGG